MEFIRQIVTTDKHDDFKTFLLVASVRHLRYVVEATLASRQVCPMPVSMFQQLFTHPLTDFGMKPVLATGTFNSQVINDERWTYPSEPYWRRSIETSHTR